MNVDDVRALLKANVSCDRAILLDDGEYYVQAESDVSGLLLCICDVALHEEDDAECHGGYCLREDSIWVTNLCIKNGPEASNLINYSVVCDDREHAIAVLWLMRHETAGYRTGRTNARPVN